MLQSPRAGFAPPHNVVRSVTPQVFFFGKKPGKKTREHVERYIRWCIGNGDDKAIDKALYNESLRDVTVSVGRALASYQASTVLAAAGKQGAW